LFDYALTYNVAVKEYFQATGDKATAIDLWPIVKSQLEIPEKYIGNDGMVDYELAGKQWLFFDCETDWIRRWHYKGRLSGPIETLMN